MESAHAGVHTRRNVGVFRGMTPDEKIAAWQTFVESIERLNRETHDPGRPFAGMATYQTGTLAAASDLCKALGCSPDLLQTRAAMATPDGEHPDPEGRFFAAFAADTGIPVEALQSRDLLFVLALLAGLN